MSEHRRRVERAMRILAGQMPYLLANVWEPEPGLAWFGLPWSKPQHHWVRMHVEALQICSAVIAYQQAAQAGEAPTRRAWVDLVGQGIQAACRSHVSDGSLILPSTNGPWGCEWQSAWWAYKLLRAAYNLRAELPAAVWQAVREVVETEADRFPGTIPPTGIRFDTKMEENGWDVPLLAWAHFVYPDHPRAAQWEQAAQLWAFNSLTVPADRCDRSWLGDRQVSQWYAGPTLHPDYTCENHGTFHPGYQAACGLASLGACAYVLHNRPVPPPYLHHLADAMRVLVYFNAPDGSLLMVTGQDWPVYHGSVHQYWPILAYFTGDPAAERLADSNLRLFERLFAQSDNGHLFGSTLEADIGDQRFFFHTCGTVALADLWPPLPDRAQLPSDAVPAPHAAATAAARAVAVQGAAPDAQPARVTPAAQAAQATAAPPGQASPAEQAERTRFWPYVEVITYKSEQLMAAAAWRSLYGHPLFTLIPLADSSWANSAPYTGLGFLEAAGISSRIRVLTHAEQVWTNGFATAGGIEWLAAGGRPWARQWLIYSWLPEGRMLLAGAVQVLADVELLRNDGWAYSFVNDLYNGKQRCVVDETGRRHTVGALQGEARQIPLGYAGVLEERLAFSASVPLAYWSSGRRLPADNRFASAQYDRLVAPGPRGPQPAGAWVHALAVTAVPGRRPPAKPACRLLPGTLEASAAGLRFSLAVVPPYNLVVEHTS